MCRKYPGYKITRWFSTKIKDFINNILCFVGGFGVDEYQRTDFYGDNKITAKSYTSEGIFPVARYFWLVAFLFFLRLFVSSLLKALKS
jgi:hypothetical protein